MKVREIITLDGWVDGSGWSWTECYGDSIIEIGGAPDDGIEWDWWEASDDPQVGGDTKITVDYYAVDADPDDDEPLATYSVWHNTLSSDKFAEMIHDWQTDNAPEHDDLEIYDPEAKDGKWVADAYDDKCTYELSDDGSGNIEIKYIGTR